ncbi:amidase [Methylobacterium planeticum]|uniref:amidase n=1 Tax=Methylobacterium planeticum TaxID=2615211 RepID=UPI001FEDA4F0|nr:amidase [Methylobacterium planeticum]
MGIASGRHPQSLVTPLWERARTLEPRLHAFAHLPDRVPDALLAGPLAGVAVGVKDLIDTADMPTACGSPIYEGRRPGRDAEIVARLRGLGATVLGKTVTTEFAWRRAGPTRNPWNLDHTPGGSSSGSAAAVAAGVVTLALGTQTFGSVIRPAAFCGVVGFKPTFGVLPRDGVQPLSPSLDHVGIFARTVEDVAVAFPLLAQHLGGTPMAPCFVGNLKVGILAPSGEPADAEQKVTLQSVRQRLVDAGAQVQAVEMPEPWRKLQRVADTLVAYEAARGLGELTKRFPRKVSAVLTELIVLGEATSETEYWEAVDAQRELRSTVAGYLNGLDAVLTIPASGEAPRGLESTGDARFCTPWTTLGFPAITLPVYLSPLGLPLGLQLVGWPGEDRALISAAVALAKSFADPVRPNLTA